MNTTQKGIITLLKSAVTGQAFPLPEGFSLETARETINKQALVTLVYEGAVLCGIPRQEPAMKELFQSYYTVLLRSERQMTKVNSLFREFETAGVDYLPFKGCVMKSLYPKPELRIMGDADILIRLPQYERIKPILEKLGFIMHTESDCELIWTCPDLYLELHKCMVQPTHREYYSYFGEGWNRAVRMDGHRYTFSAEDMYIYLFMHFAKHYRSGGIGCRHVLDIWMYRRANPEMNESYVNRELEKLNLRQFHAHFLRMLDVWFGDGQADEITRFIEKRIFSGGSWGNAEDYKIAVELARRKQPGNLRHSRTKYTLWLLFPPLAQMRKKYPLLERLPFLLPVMWVVRGMTVLLRKPEKLGAAVQTGKLITDDALSAHQEALRMVGLELREVPED